ncbi:c-type cytochrome [Flavitalea sp. BT771]|uniref:c-type cytochrome n=1 Tax=Flavitalea sp. BT771 TaxID=3063329 RepID=UPI0026E22ECC|nr:c-type cytochrome [Flavitalea sp. BT771]MDO6429562.1 c-type cytochrome [Flavitalea sp. BT771]MDV6218310.1 c-type cytochrome [Flavitalea sp. BT771]
MKKNNTHVLIIGITLLLFLCSAAIDPPKSEYRNLKVLPANITSKAMSKIMVDEFSDALGVSCGFCHAEEAGSHRLDYASDAKPEKAMARIMMRMTLRINKQYFNGKHPKLEDPALVITCNTCHNGQPHPDNVSLK